MKKSLIGLAAAAGLTAASPSPISAHDGHNLNAGIDLISVDLSCSDENGNDDHYQLRVFPTTHDDQRHVVHAEFAFVTDERISPFSSISPNDYDASTHTQTFNIIAWPLPDETNTPFHENYRALSIRDDAYTAQFEINYPTDDGSKVLRQDTVTCDIPDMGF